MKKSKILTIIISSILTIFVMSIIIAIKESDKGYFNKLRNKVTVESISDYVVKLPTYTDIDYETGLKKVNEKYDGWSNQNIISSEILGGSCTSSAKVMENGDMVLARNMDLTLTEAPEFVYYINTPGKYKSFNITYIRNYVDYDEVLKYGIDKDKYDYIPYLATDAINEYGLVIEMNMRSDEYDIATGNLILSSTGTNPESNTRILVTSLVRYLADNAKSVEESLAILGAINNDTKERYGNGELNIYSMNTETNKWNLAFQIADATGNFGVIEFVDNKVMYHPFAKAQANYYLTKEYRDQELYASGESRVDTILKDYDSIKTIFEMTSNMTKVRYGYMTNYKYSPYDVKTEYVNIDVFNAIRYLEKHANELGYTVPDYQNLYQTKYDSKNNEYVKVDVNNYMNYLDALNVWTTEFVLNEEKNEEVKLFVDWYSNFYNSISDVQRRKLGIFWVTTHLVTYNASKKYAIVTFYEDESTTRVFSLNDID